MTDSSNADSKKEKKSVPQRATKTQKKLTGQQRLFIRKYIQCGVATKAAILAGYSRKSAGSISAQLMANPKIKSEIIRFQESLATRTQISRESLLRDVQLIKEKAIHGEPIYDEDGDLIDLAGMDDKTALSAIQTQARILGIGGYGGTKVDVTNNITNNNQYNYDLTVLTKEERVSLIALLSKCRVLEEDEKPKQIESKEPEAVIDVTPQPKEQEVVLE